MAYNIFALQVLMFLEGIVGILAGNGGGVPLFLGIDGIKTQRAERRKRQRK